MSFDCYHPISFCTIFHFQIYFSINCALYRIFLLSDVNKRRKVLYSPNLLQQENETEINKNRSDFCILFFTFLLDCSIHSLHFFKRNKKKLFFSTFCSHNHSLDLFYSHIWYSMEILREWLWKFNYIILFMYTSNTRSSNWCAHAYFLVSFKPVRHF